MTPTKSITECDGYRSLRASVDHDLDRNFRSHNYEGKFQWVIDRAKHYADALDMEPADILDAWETSRDYWYMNYYQECNQPKIEADSVRVFETIEELKASIGPPRFRCPSCEGVSSSAYTCDSGIKRDGKPCNWKVYGLFGALGKGTFVYVKEKLSGQTIFMPVAWESTSAEQSTTPQAA
ncbi:hypothetical protein [Flexibacterium corallicola]|uniref:hypothetical protein n=1 Tax=Flexibacterium corallicola TaxID=3037259 RepID=UPI00286F94A7|nr:hypothetical protein [Pseudovibrio sp. M1P-2-3]